SWANLCHQDHVFDFPEDEPEPHPAYDFFTYGPLPGYVGNPNNNNGWIEADVIAPVVGMDEDIAMLFGDDDSEDDDFSDDDSEEVEDEEVWEVNEEWLMAPVTPPLVPAVQPPSVYEVGGSSTAAAEGPSFPHSASGLPVPPSVIEDLSIRLDNLEYEHGLLVKKVIQVSDVEVAVGVSIGEIGPRVFAIERQVQYHGRTFVTKTTCSTFLRMSQSHIQLTISLRMDRYQDMSVIAPVVGMDEDIAMLFGDDDSEDDDFSDDDSEEVEDEEVWEVNEEWLMAPVTPPLVPAVQPPSIYEVGGSSTAAAEGPSFPHSASGLSVPPSVIEDLSIRLDNLEYEHGLLVKKVIQVSDVEVAVGVSIGEIGPRVFAIERQVQRRAAVTLMQCILGLDRRLTTLERRPQVAYEKETFDEEGHDVV
nr:hypothetical protein [Tanacetum cinerariifolium]